MKEEIIICKQGKGLRRNQTAGSLVVDRTVKKRTLFEPLTIVFV